MNDKIGSILEGLAVSREEIDEKVNFKKKEGVTISKHKRKAYRVFYTIDGVDKVKIVTAESSASAEKIAREALKGKGSVRRVVLDDKNSNSKVENGKLVRKSPEERKKDLSLRIGGLKKR